jgi:hypothetical protein
MSGKNVEVKELDFSIMNIKTLTAFYNEGHDDLLAQIEALQKKQNAFPIKVMKDIAFDDLVLQAASYKHQSLTILRRCIAAAESAELDYKFSESFFLLNKAGELLRDKGFDKVTDSLRQAATASCLELRDLAKSVACVRSLEETCSRLFRSFESDEVNFRKLYDKNDYKGI